MGYDVCVWGELTFPPGKKEAWLASPVDVRTFDDWPESFAWEEEEFDEDFEADDVAGLFADLRGFGPPVFVDIQEGPTTTRLRIYWSESEHADFKRELAAAFRAAAAFGADGGLVFVSGRASAEDFGYRVVVGQGESTFQALDEHAFAELAPNARAIEELAMKR